MLGENKMNIILDILFFTSEQKETVQDFLSWWSHIFSQGSTYLGKTTIVEHEIHMTYDHPFTEPFRKLENI